MEQVFPEQMDTIDYDSLQKAVQQIESYVRYMRERIEFSIRNVSKTAASAGSFSVEYVDRLRELETEVTQLKTQVNTALSTANSAASRATLAEANSSQALSNTIDLILRGPVEIDEEPDEETPGFIGQILIWNGHVYICTAAADEEFTWKEV